jgi:hypothetical protein
MEMPCAKYFLQRLWDGVNNADYNKSQLKAEPDVDLGMNT